MSQSAEEIPALIQEWKFSVDDEEGAWGEIGGVPTALTPLGYDPPAVMFAFRVQHDAKESPELTSLVQHLAPETVRLSIDDGCAWLSLYDVEALPKGELRELPQRIVTHLTGAGLSFPPGCVRCGRIDQAVPMLVDLRPTRLCADCVTDAVEEKEAAEEALNRPTMRGTLGLSGALVYVVLGWTLYWSVVEWMLDSFADGVVEINRFTMLVGGIACIGFGYALGWPLGATLRRSIGLRRIPWIASGLLATGAAILGEIGSIGVFIFRVAGVANLRLAAQLLGDAVASYTVFWIFCKVAHIVAITCCSASSAKERKTVPVHV